jgi:hypothetical protein
MILARVQTSVGVNGVRRPLIRGLRQEAESISERRKAQWLDSTIGGREVQY